MALRTALRVAATPDLYRRNAFRLAGNILPLGVTEVDTAGQPRRGPAARAVDEFFWFRPEAPFDGDVARADAAWEAAGTDVAHHNLAVLNHLLALDLDHEVRVGAAQWRRAYKFWLRVWRSDTFWDAYGAGAATIREELPLVLARIGAAVAVRWAERRQSDDMVKAHWQLVEYDGFPDDVRAAAREAAIGSVTAHIGTLVERANDEVRRFPRSVATIARSLNEQVAPALHVLGLASAITFSDRYHPACDAVGRQLLRYTVIYFEQTRDWNEGLKLLYLADSTASYRAASEIRAYAGVLERQRDADQQRAEPGRRIIPLPTFHLPVPDLGNLDWPSDLS